MQECEEQTCNHLKDTQKAGEDSSFDEIEWHLSETQLITIVITGDEREVIEVGDRDKYVLDLENFS